MATRKLVFFLRDYNDIDHITPVIYKALKVRTYPIAVVMLAPKSYLSDYRIAFLRQFPQFELYHISDFIPESVLEFAPKQAAPHPTGWQRLLRRFKPAPPAAANEVGAYGEAEIERMLDRLFEETVSGVVAFDWISLSAHLRFAQLVIAAARKRGLGNVSLPHGDSPYYNVMFNRTDINYNAVNHFSANPFDVVVVPNALTARRYIPHKGVDRVKVLGSPRYNDEWLKVLGMLLPTENALPQALTQPNDKLRIVVFLRNALFPIFWQEVATTLELLAQFEEVQVIVKHHTRTVSARLSASEDRPVHEVIAKHRNLTSVYDEVHSGALLQWADVVIDLGTSIAFEAVKREIPVLALEYVHPNISTIAYYFPDHAPQCRDQVYDAIVKRLVNEQALAYDKIQRQRFIREMIDTPDEQVLMRYVLLLESLCYSVKNGKDTHVAQNTLA